MARSPLTDTSDDLIQDSGSVLWSFVKGEQLEFPITLNFVEDATQAYVYEAVVVEALNVTEQTTRPVTIKPNGVQTVLVVRVPTNRGTWDAPQAYNKEEVVLYNGVYYKLLKGVARVNSTPPAADPMWQVTSLSKIYIQFPASLGSTWAVAPIVGSAVYGFFELRVTEPPDSIFRRTWKPVRGMVEILFSPTDIVPDV
jgi:hypothetical protein